MRIATTALALAGAIALASTGCDVGRKPAQAGDVLPGDIAAPANAPAVATPPPAAPSPHASAPDPNATIPRAFQGSWAADAIACRMPAHESRLTLLPDRVAFYAGAGPVKSAVVDGNDITVLAILNSEGQTDETTYVFHLSDDGNTLTDISTGPGMVRQRCAGPAPG